MILASSIIGTVLHPIFVVAGTVLAFFYSLVPNYAAAIALLTVAVMILVFPLTRMSARSMMRMQLLSPEMKKIQARYKAKPGMSTQERQELRTKMNEEVMALYRENGVNPTGGCLPMFLQFPILIVLYDVVRGLSKEHVYPPGHVPACVGTPQNIPHTSTMYHDLVASCGNMHALGINLADSVRTPQAHWYDVIPYAVMVLIAVGLQYVSIWQVTTRNPAASSAPSQMQTMQKFMPLIFLFLYIALPAGVGVYFIVSSLFRIGQQEWMYKHDPTITAAIKELNKRKADAPPEPPGPKKSFRERLREAADPMGTNSLASGPKGDKPPPKGYTPPRSQLNGGTAGAKGSGSKGSAGKRPGTKPAGGGSSNGAKGSTPSGGGSSTNKAPNPGTKPKRPPKGQ